MKPQLIYLQALLLSGCSASKDGEQPGVVSTPNNSELRLNYKFDGLYLDSKKIRQWETEVDELFATLNPTRVYLNVEDKRIKSSQLVTRLKLECQKGNCLLYVKYPYGDVDSPKGFVQIKLDEVEIGNPINPHE